MVREPTHEDAVALLRAGGREYMAHVDLDLVRRIVPVCYLLMAFAIVATLGFVEPTALIGATPGWVLSALIVGGIAAAAVWVQRTGHPPRLDAIYAIDLGVLAGLGAIGWLARDGDLYSSLPILLLIVVAATYPPRRVALAVAVAFAAQVPALLSVGADVDSIVELILHGFAWVCLCALAVLWTAGVRVQRRAMREHARIDTLTGLGNRRAFDEAAVTELARAARSGSPLSLLVGDLDAFKEINDRHGHLAGDACLRAAAGVVRDLTRRPDSCFRWGGDEFVLLLPDADESHARAIADRLSDAVAGACARPDGRPLTLAFGVAERDGEHDARALLARADRDRRAAKVGAGLDAA
jgi:diguanylate cyclase (GGDEF)-like protein